MLENRRDEDLMWLLRPALSQDLVNRFQFSAVLI